MSKVNRTLIFRQFGGAMEQRVEPRNVTMYARDWEVVDSLAQSKGLTVSTALRMIVREWVEHSEAQKRAIPSRPSLTDLIAGPALEQGVVALTCGCCKKVVGVINADAARRESENGVLHFCQECMALPEAEIVARLNASVATEGEL